MLHCNIVVPPIPDGAGRRLRRDPILTAASNASFTERCFIKSLRDTASMDSHAPIGRAAPGPDPAPLRRARRKDSRPSEVIEAARALFVERGFAATKLEDVA